MESICGKQDEALQASEDRCTELAAEKAQLMLQLGDTANQLQARENRLAEVLEGRAKLRRQLDQSHADFTAMQASLKAELVAVQASTPELARNLHPLAPTRDIWHWYLTGAFPTRSLHAFLFSGQRP